jgi:pimeloyl-ACP methyl ester carboxylesterase
VVRVVTASVALGVVGAVLVPAVLLPGAAEHTTTGALLVAFGLGWAALAGLTIRLTAMPQRWALVPAAVMGVTGLALIAFAPGDKVLQTAGYAWPPLLLALTGWILVQLRRAMRSRARWLLYPVLAVLAISSIGGLLQTVAERNLRTDTAPGRLISVAPGRQLHLHCAGSGSPTVVLNNALGGSSADWARILDATVPTTRVCAYDRAGQGWSEPAREPQDSTAVVADLRHLLEQADEPAPFVLAGYSAGGAYAMAYAAQHPEDVAGLVLLDSMSPEQFTILPDFPRVHAGMTRLYGLAPTLARIGVGQLVRALSAPEPTGDAGEQALAVGASARNWRTTRDEHSVYRRALAQAGALTTLGDKPVAVVSASGTLDGTSGWRAAQAQLATLSSDTSTRTVDSEHADVLIDEIAAQQSADAIVSTVDSVRNGTSLRTAASS